jgi:hypothetical protein
MTPGKARTTSEACLAIALATVIGCAAPKPAEPTAAPPPVNADAAHYAPDTSARAAVPQPQDPAPGPGLPPVQPSTQPAAKPATPAPSRQVPKPQDAQPVPQLFFHVYAYYVSVPKGEISGNEALWKPVDEQIVDFATSDILWKNGVRVGAAPLELLGPLGDKYFASAITSKSAIVGFEARGLEISVAKDIPQQTIFMIDRDNLLQGRTYDASDNLLRLSFQATPRKPNTVRLSFSPCVRSQRKRWDPSLLAGNPDRLVNFTATEVMLDLNLRVDMPMDHFLLVAPSPESKLENSVGRVFLTENNGVEVMERAIIIVVKAQPLQPGEAPGVPAPAK